MEETCDSGRNIYHCADCRVYRSDRWDSDSLSTAGKAREAVGRLACALAGRRRQSAACASTEHADHVGDARAERLAGPCVPSSSSYEALVIDVPIELNSLFTASRTVRMPAVAPSAIVAA